MYISAVAALVQVAKDPEVFSETGAEGFTDHQRIPQIYFPFFNVGSVAV